VTAVFTGAATVILSRQVTEPLVSLKEGVDHAATRNYHIHFELDGDGEAAELARNAQNLTSFLRKKR